MSGSYQLWKRKFFKGGGFLENERFEPDLVDGTRGEPPIEEIHQR